MAQKDFRVFSQEEYDSRLASYDRATHNTLRLGIYGLPLAGGQLALSVTLFAESHPKLGVVALVTVGASFLGGLTGVVAFGLDNNSKGRLQGENPEYSRENLSEATEAVAEKTAPQKPKLLWSQQLYDQEA